MGHHVCLVPPLQDDYVLCEKIDFLTMPGSRRQYDKPTPDSPPPPVPLPMIVTGGRRLAGRRGEAGWAEQLWRQCAADVSSSNQGVAVEPMHWRVFGWHLLAWRLWLAGHRLHNKCGSSRALMERQATGSIEARGLTMHRHGV